MTAIRKNYNAAFKAGVAIEAIKQEKTISQISSEFGVHPNLVGKWRKHLLQELPSLFTDKRKKVEKESEALKDELYRQIGQLKVELDWLKKKSAEQRYYLHSHTTRFHLPCSRH
jgi:transposase-like protein